ncbi:hypothetical protein N5T66_07740 [Aliarcobacter cryaerophilus]|uniref:hypothetical protein n=1 Tax=Aliarcobacter cryaerophilus TaxID=28198 RepID=UPI0021B35AB5|nr:hypothetical protein [Aliarcobacter cryaerophilus]MCT7433176.1 hypothetical protein [Aliarcobacter cryaerophilus]
MIDNRFKIIVVIKVLVLLSFSSQYNDELFFGFVNSLFIKDFNPWEYYFNNNLNLDAFPYHPLMLFILYPFAIVANSIEMHSLFKIPLILSDIAILFVLLKLFPNRQKATYIYYFLNPIIIYAIYIHSQLDIIPTAILVWSIYFLVLKRYIYSSVCLGLSLATKFHIIVALPLIVFYLYKTTNLRNIGKYTFISLLIFLVFDLPFIFTEGFQQMVLFNHKQALLFDSFYNIGELKLLLPVAAILSVYMHFFNQNKVNDDLLYFYFGILFVSILIFVSPSPAWYVWIVPFISIYFIQNKNTNKNMLLYFCFSISYLIFFVFFYKSEYKDILFLGNEINFKIENDKFRNLSFTFLEVMLLAIMYAFYKYGIKSNSIYKKQTNLVIGIGGDSGVGKSTLLNNLEKLVGSDKFLQIEGDGEHKWERGDENWNKFTHLDPKANHIHKQAEAIYHLKHNENINRSEYDHHTGKFTEAQKVEPKEFIVIAGLHPFYLPKLRKNIDLKIFIDTDENLRRHWKIIRDTKKRGYSIEKILEQIEARMGDANKYIYPQKDFADMVINFFSINSFDLGNEKEIINLGLKITLDANIHIEEILEELDCDFSWDYNDDLKSQYIELLSIPKNDFKELALDVIENLNELISTDVKFDIGYDGFIQLLALKMISEKLKDGNNG